MVSRRGRRSLLPASESGAPSDAGRESVFRSRAESGTNCGRSLAASESRSRNESKPERSSESRKVLSRSMESTRISSRESVRGALAKLSGLGIRPLRTKVFALR